MPIKCPDHGQTESYLPIRFGVRLIAPLNSDSHGRLAAKLSRSQVLFPYQCRVSDHPIISQNVVLDRGDEAPDGGIIFLSVELVLFGRRALLEPIGAALSSRPCNRTY